MTIGKRRRAVHDPKLPPGYGLILPMRPPPKSASPAQWRWFFRASRELTFPTPHVDQLMMLLKRGVAVPPGQWVALSDPFTADPEMFRRAGCRPRSNESAGNGRRSDKVLQIIQVIAALALDRARADEPENSSAVKISRALEKEGLAAPGRTKGYSSWTVKKWRQQCDVGSHRLAALYADGRKIFQGVAWLDVLQLACVEARLRTALHKLHHVDPDGSKARTGFQEFVNERKQEHDRIQQEHFFPGSGR